MTTAFRHSDHERTIIFGPDALAAIPALVDAGYTLLTTARAASTVPAIVDRAGAVVEVPAGLVEATAGQLRGQISGERLVAFGGGRVIDTAKAIAAAEGLEGPVAIPTSLSGAEMTGVHRHAAGVSGDTPRSRASIVINDPALSASQAEEQLAASSANALGHAITALLSSRSTTIARAVAAEAISTLAGGWSAAEPDRPAIALGALLAGWAIDHSGLGPHHVLSQTAVRVAGVGHAEANAALLPETLEALAARTDESLPLDLAEELRSRASAFDLGALGSDAALLDRAVETAAARAGLERVPPAFTAEEIRAIYRSACEPGGAADDA